MARKAICWLVLLVIATGVIYSFLLRPWHLHWGATVAEAAQRMPGDEIVKAPWIKASRAITIRATPEEVWPWLVQMGYHRAGWYTYDWIDNDGARSAI